MAKLYSSLLFLLSFLFASSLYAQQNVGVGTSNPLQKLDVSGAIRIGTSSQNLAGSIRYNDITRKFEGCDSTGGAWKEFGGSGADDDWRKSSGSGTPIITDDMYHTGNVGVGTTIPLAKLHVKGLGNVAIKAETSNSNDTIPAINASNTTGIAIRAITSSNTKPAFYSYSKDGLAIKAESKADTMPTIWAISDSSIAVRGQTKNKQWYGVEAVNKDSAGYALKAWNSRSLNHHEGGNAALFVGDVTVEGAIRNTDDSKYQGSVAINDGLSVGNIYGANCVPATAAYGTFSKDYGTAGFNIVGTNKPIQDFDTISNLNLADTNSCRGVTNYHIEFSIFEYQDWPINLAFFVRGTYIESIVEPDGNLALYPPMPEDYPTGPLIDLYYDASGDGYLSTWGYNISGWNGTDPSGINWYVKFEEYSGEGDVVKSLSGVIDYKYADSTTSPFYAAFGEVRASGSLYANSITEYGDVAEFFRVNSASRKPEPGDIVSISKDMEEGFALSNNEYDALMVGVISENPSVFINNPSAGEPIGLTGRVKVKVNLNGGKIKPGDPITSSSMEGVGMKANSDGTIVGYALESFDGSRADLGKIWILLSKGHVEKANPITKVHQFEGKELSGMQINGSMKVEKNQTEVFVPWDKQTAGRIPADVELDDLYVEVTPFGGNAKLFVKEVDEKGLYVSIAEKTDGFRGFYYKLDMLSSLEPTPISTVEIPTFASNDERTAYAKQLYQDWTSTFKQLEREGGMSLANLEQMPVKEALAYKKKVMENWKANHQDLFAKWKNMGAELDAVMANDASILRKIREN